MENGKDTIESGQKEVSEMYLEIVKCLIRESKKIAEKFKKLDMTETIEEIIGKATAKKVLTTNYSVCDICYYCPECLSIIKNPDFNYCPICGQKLDFKKEG